MFILNCPQILNYMPAIAGKGPTCTRSHDVYAEAANGLATTALHLFSPADLPGGIYTHNSSTQLLAVVIATRTVRRSHIYQECNN